MLSHYQGSMFFLTCFLKFSLKPSERMNGSNLETMGPLSRWGTMWNMFVSVKLPSSILQLLLTILKQVCITEQLGLKENFICLLIFFKSLLTKEQVMSLLYIFEALLMDLVTTNYFIWDPFVFYLKTISLSWNGTCDRIVPGALMPTCITLTGKHKLLI